MGNTVIYVPCAYINLSPELFRKYATDYSSCYNAYKPDGGESPIHYFLVCRSIEFALKAMHLEEKSRKEVKDQYGHDLKKLYDELPPDAKVLAAHESQVLNHASEIYDVPNKGFEYVSVFDAVTGYQKFPDRAVLVGIVNKLLHNR
ncbi:MAG: hypothetical protein ABI881_15400 [Betaproteobacteria bacterium]